MADEYTVESALKELREMFPDAKFITISGDYTIRWDGKNTASTRIQIASSWRDGKGGGLFNGETIGDAMTQVKQWQESQKER